MTATVTSRADGLAAALNAAGIRASVWRKAGAPRVYLNGHGRDIKAWFDVEDDKVCDFDPACPTAGTTLRVYSDCAQPRAWLINRAKQVKYAIMVSMHDAGLIPDVCESWQDVYL